MPLEQPLRRFDGVSGDGQRVSVVAAYRYGQWRLSGPARSCAAPEPSRTLAELVAAVERAFDLRDVTLR